MLSRLFSLNLILPFFLPTTLALAPNLVRSTPVSYAPPPTSAALSQDDIPNFISLPHTSLNNTLTNEPICLTDHGDFDPPARSDCDAIIEDILLNPSAMSRRTWGGSGTLPIWENVYETCRFFLFVKEPISGRIVKDTFGQIELAVAGAKILKACVSVTTPGQGGEVAVGPNKKLVLVISGPRRRLAGTATS